MVLTKKTKINLQNRTFKRKKINLNQTIKKNKKINFTLKNKVGGSSPEHNKDEFIKKIIYILRVYYLKNINEVGKLDYFKNFENLKNKLKKVDGNNIEIFNIFNIIIKSDILKQKILDNLEDLSKDPEESDFFEKFQKIYKMEGINDKDKIMLIKKQKLDEVTEIALNDMINYGFLNYFNNDVIVVEEDIIKLNPKDEGYSVFIDKRNFDISQCSINGQYSDSILFTLGFFYDKILPESLKGNVYLHRKIIFSPHYEQSIRNEFYIENEFLFFENLDNFLLQCENSVCQICIALVLLNSNNKKIAHFTVVVLDKTKDPHTIEYYDSNSNKAYYGKNKNNNSKNHSIGKNVSFFYDKLNRNKTTLEEIYGRTLNIVGSEYIRQFQFMVCGVWSNFTGIFRMFGITKDEIEEGLGTEQTKESVMNSQKNKLFSYSKLFMDLIVKILDLKESSDPIKSNIIKDKLINDEKMFDFLGDEKKADRIKYEKEILFPPQFKMKEADIEMSNVNIRELLYRFPYFLIKKETNGEFKLTYLETNHEKEKFDEFIKEKFELGEPQEDTSTSLKTIPLKQIGISVTKEEEEKVGKEKEKEKVGEEKGKEKEKVEVGMNNTDRYEKKVYKSGTNNYQVEYLESKIEVKKISEEGETINELDSKKEKVKNYNVGDFLKCNNDIILKCVDLKQSSSSFIRIKELPIKGNIIEINLP